MREKIIIEFEDAKTKYKKRQRALIRGVIIAALLFALVAGTVLFITRPKKATSYDTTPLPPGSSRLTSQWMGNGYQPMGILLVSKGAIVIGYTTENSTKIDVINPSNGGVLRTIALDFSAIDIGRVDSEYGDIAVVYAGGSYIIDSNTAGSTPSQVTASDFKNDQTDGVFSDTASVDGVICSAQGGTMIFAGRTFETTLSTLRPIAGGDGYVLWETESRGEPKWILTPVL